MKICKNKSKLKLPSNKKFGFFFSAIFLLISSYYLYLNEQIVVGLTHLMVMYTRQLFQ